MKRRITHDWEHIMKMLNVSGTLEIFENNESGMIEVIEVSSQEIVDSVKISEPLYDEYVIAVILDYSGETWR